MSQYKQQALEIVNRLHQEDRIDSGDYAILHNGLCENVCGTATRNWRNYGRSSGTFQWTPKRSVSRPRSWAGALASIEKKSGNGLINATARAWPI